MARTIATTTTVTLVELLEFVRPRHQAILTTTRADGRPQMSPNTLGVDDSGRLVISSYPMRAKVYNIRRNPAVSISAYDRPQCSKSTVMLSRVVPGTGEVINRSWPSKALTSVDLPAFGRPTTAILGRSSPWASSIGATGIVARMLSISAPVPSP